jgi:RNA polymerase-binding transcription factor DksA
VRYHYLTIEQRETLTNLIRSHIVSRAQLEIALKRLHQPDYGVCIDCGKDIGFVRLKVDPWTLHCQACARLPISASEQQEALA